MDSRVPRPESQTTLHRGPPPLGFSIGVFGSRFLVCLGIVTKRDSHMNAHDTNTNGWYHFCFTLLLLCVQALEIEAISPPKQLRIAPVSRVDWGYLTNVGSITVAQNECVQDRSVLSDTPCDTLRTAMFIEVYSWNSEHARSPNQFVSTLSIELSRDRASRSGHTTYSVASTKWANLTCSVPDPGHAPPPLPKDCFDTSNRTFILQGALATDTAPYTPLVVQMTQEGDVNYDGSNIYLQTLDYAGTFKPMDNFYPLQLFGSTAGKFQSKNVPYFRMGYSKHSDSYVIFALRHTGEDPGERFYDPILTQYSAQGQYQGSMHNMGGWNTLISISGVSEPVVDPESGRVYLIIPVDDQDVLDSIGKEFGIDNIIVPEWVTWQEGTSVILILSPDTKKLLNIYMHPLWTFMSPCEFYTRQAGEDGRYLVCSGSKIIRTNSRTYDISQVAVLDTKQNTVQVQPVPGPSTNTVPSSNLYVHVLDGTPCGPTASTADNGNAVQALLYGSEGMIQARTGSIVHGSRGVLQHVDLTHLFAMDSSDTDNKEKRTKPTDQTTLVVPNITYWEALLPDRILSRTIVAADDPTSHVNDVNDVKRVNPDLPNLFLLSTKFHGAMTHTSWSNAHNYNQIQLVDICDFVDGPVDPKSDPSSPVSTQWVVGITAGVFVSVGVAMLLLRQSQNRKRNRPDSASLLERESTTPPISSSEAYT